MELEVIRHEFDRYVAQNRRSLFLFCRGQSAGSEEAEDILQDALLKAWLAFDRYDRSSSFPAWIKAIARNVATDHYRRSIKNFSNVSLDEFPLPVPDTAPSLESAVVSSLWERKLVGDIESFLQPKQFAVLMAVVIEGMSYGDASQKLGIGLGTVRSRLSRGRQRCMKYLSLEQYQ